MSFVSDNTFGTLSSAPDKSIINHIYGYLFSIVQNFKGSSGENENSITNRLCKTLNSKKPAESSYYFHHQNLEDEKENTSTDFAAFGTFAYATENNIEDESPPLIKFEAKRLNSTLSKNREREYVIGEYENGKRIKNSGGIERFKNGRHGKDIVYAGIIGYVQTDSFTFWLEKINGWIGDEIKTPNDSSLTWQEDDILIDDMKEEHVSCYTSKTKRLSGDILLLRHYWINLT